MKTIPNPEYYHKLIGLYLDVDEKFFEANSQHLFGIAHKGSQEFFFELVHRSLDQIVTHHGYGGVCDLKGLNLDLAEDFNTRYVAAAGQIMNDVRTVSSYSGIMANISNYFNKMQTLTGDEDAITMQAFHEGAALKLMGMYFGSRVGEKPRVSLDDDKNYKDVRCALWRYLMYSGFIQVDKNFEIVKNSIPNMDLLPRLTKRFFQLYRISDSEDTIQKISESFLRFNNVKSEIKTDLVR